MAWQRIASQCTARHRIAQQSKAKNYIKKTMDIKLIESLNLNPGDYIPPQTVEHIIGFTFDDSPREYQLEHLKLVKLIKNYLTRKLGDRQVECCQRDNGIQILDETETAFHFHKEWKKQIRRTRRALHSLSHRQLGEMTPEAKELTHSLRLRYQGMLHTMSKLQRKYPAPLPKQDSPFVPITSLKQRKRFS